MNNYGWFFRGYYLQQSRCVHTTFCGCSSPVVKLNEHGTRYGFRHTGGRRQDKHRSVGGMPSVVVNEFSSMNVLRVVDPEPRG